MKEVILKSDLEKWIQEKIRHYKTAWLPSEQFRAGALEALTEFHKQLYLKHSDLKGGDNNGNGE